ncbi:MAG: PAS domain S-box protein [bacterium]|nr:PAS domain S-box protein [bacterium]
MGDKIKTIVSNVLAISLRWKMYSIGIFIVLMFLFIHMVLIIPRLEKEKFEERKGKLKAVVESPVSLMDYYENALRRQAWKENPAIPRTLEEAKRFILNNLREVYYDKTESFFVLNGDGIMIMHPVKKELEGRNMFAVKDHEDALVFKELVINSQRDGEAYVSSVWQSKYSPLIFEPQITYAKYYWPWDLIVCSTVYTQDIVDSMREFTILSIVYISLTGVIAMIIMFGIIHITLKKPLGMMLEGIEEIQQGNLDHAVAVTYYDELGYLSEQFNYMVYIRKRAEERIRESETKYKELTGMLPDIVYETDINLMVSYFNKAGYTLLGYTDEDIKQGLSIKDFMEEADYLRFANLFKRYDGKEELGLLTTHKITTRDGRVIYGENNTIVISDERTGYRGLRGIIRDVTEKLEMEQTLAVAQNKYNEELERQVKSRTVELQLTNESLTESYDTLKKTQKQLVEAEKMAALGGLVAGVAHEINTPVGIGVTASSFLEMQVAHFFELFSSNKLKRTDLEDFFDKVAKASTSISFNLNRAVELLAVFKQAAVDQSSEDRRKFELRTYIEEALLSLRTKYKTTKHKIILNCPEGIIIESFPWVFFQVIDGLLENSILHAFEGIVEGEIVFDISVKNNQLLFCYRDNGIGMDEAKVKKIFDPFYTTKRGQGGTGLGMHIVYNLVVQKLGGEIECTSSPGEGTAFILRIPYTSLVTSAE